MEPHVKDILWKGVIEDLFADFLRFFYTHAEEVINFERGFQFLDKELEQLYPGEEIRHPKFVDKLVKVYRRDGVEQWFLVHIEVQGYKDLQFPRRMFTYFYRVLDRFEEEVASIAIFIDDDKHYQPSVYEYNFLDTSIIFRYKTYKVIEQNIATLENSDNPFAMVVLAVLLALQKSELGDEGLLKISLDLVKRLFRKGFSKDKISIIFNFVKAYVCLGNREMFYKFERGIEEITFKKRNMGVLELATMLIKQEERKETTAELQTDFVRNLLNKTAFSLQEIADLVGVSIDFVIKVKG